MKAVIVKEYGGPEVMSYEEVDMPTFGASDVLVKVEAAGINFIDTYQRSGLYPVPLPTTLGLEAAGTVEELGADVTHFSKGDRVAYTSVAGAYAEYAAVPEEKLVSLPDGVGFNAGAAAMLQGCTAHHLPDQERRQLPDSCRRRRRRPDPDPDGEDGWRLRDRHRLDRGESRTSEGCRCRRGDTLFRAGF